MPALAKSKKKTWACLPLSSIQPLLHFRRLMAFRVWPTSRYGSARCRSWARCAGGNWIGSAGLPRLASNPVQSVRERTESRLESWDANALIKGPNTRCRGSACPGIRCTPRHYQCHANPRSSQPTLPLPLHSQRLHAQWPWLLQLLLDAPASAE